MRRFVVFTLLGFLLMTLLGPLTHAVGLELATIDVALIIVLHLALVDRRGGAFRPSARMGVQSGLFDVGSVVVGDRRFDWGNTADGQAQISSPRSPANST